MLNETGPDPGPFRFSPYICRMIALVPFISLSVLTLLQGPGTPPVYRGFSPGMEYRVFAAQARALAEGDVLRCNTSVHTAQLMECGVVIRDPSDSARFYLSAYVIEGKIAMVSFGDSGDARLVDRMRRDLARRFGPARALTRGGWEWKNGHWATRLNWRGQGAARWIYVNLTDYDLMDRVSRYRNPA
jgi:hypothetical protein